MNLNIAHRVARYVALPVVAVGIGCGAVLGLAGPASATTVNSQSVLVATPQTTAQPATSATPGDWWHRHHPSLLDPTAAANFTAPEV